MSIHLLVYSFFFKTITQLTTSGLPCTLSLTLLRITLYILFCIHMHVRLHLLGVPRNSNSIEEDDEEGGRKKKYI